MNLIQSSRPAPIRSVGAIVAAILVTGCGPDVAASSRCDSSPLPSNTTIPLLSKPFKGEFALINHFDHDKPNEFSDDNGYQISWCGARRTWETDGHGGYDWVMDVGTPILAAGEGVVDAAGTQGAFDCPLLGKKVDDQLAIEITHVAPSGELFTSGVKHLSQVNVAVGDHVEEGQLIGLSGNTGCSTRPHLHFETWRLSHTNNDKPVHVDAFGWQGEGVDPWSVDSDGAVSVWLWKPGGAPHITPDDP